MGMLSLVRRLISGPAQPPGDPLFHPPRGPHEVSDRVDELDLDLERDRETKGRRIVLAALSALSFSGASGVPGLGGEPVVRASIWSERDRFER
jgi:hypothetical protein